MRKGIFPFIFSGSFFLLTSCGSLKLKTGADFHFAKNTTFAISNEGDETDKTGAVKELKYLLAQSGFNMVTLSNAAKAVNYPNEILLTKNNSQIIEIYSIKDLKSVYIIEIYSDYYYDVFYYSYTSFYAKIIDINANKIVMTAHFKGDRKIKAVISDFAKILTNQLK